jgi:hypothetical protein
MKFNDEALIAMCIMFGFTIIISLVFWYFHTETEKQSLYKQTYAKSMECRIAFKGRSPSEVNSYCGEIPKLGDFLTK